MVTKSKELLVARLKKYIDKLECGEKVVKRDLKSVLTPAELENIDLEWENAKAYKQSIVDMDEELSTYTEKLHTADKIFNIAENNQGLPKSQRNQRYKDAEKHYERALEHLQELLAGNFGLHIALDRRIDFTPDFEPSPDPVGVPRYVLSRSHNTEKTAWPTIRSIRIDALESKLASRSGKAPKNSTSAHTANIIKRAAQLRNLAKRLE